MGRPVARLVLWQPGVRVGAVVEMNTPLKLNWSRVCSK